MLIRYWLYYIIVYWSYSEKFFSRTPIVRLDGKRNPSIASQLGNFQINLLSMMCSPSCPTKFVLDWIGDVKHIPTMRFFNGISRNTQSKSYILSLTEWVQAFQCNALWDTHQHALFVGILIVIKLRQQTPTHGSAKVKFAPF